MQLFLWVCVYLGEEAEESEDGYRREREKGSSVCVCVMERDEDK